MKGLSRIIGLGLFLMTAMPGFSIRFVNLDFESANVSAYNDQPSSVPATNAIPGWTAYIGGNPQSDIIYNDRPLSAATVTLQSSNSQYSVIQGSIQGDYHVELFADSDYFTTDPTYVQSAAIGQTGTIPFSAKSITFWGSMGDMQITFNGIPLDFFGTGSGPNYTIYAADVSAYAGQTGELLFEAPTEIEGAQPPGYLWGGGGDIDNIQFSATEVPEPGELALIAMGGLFFGLTRALRRR
jgi:hypothetical protein